VISKVAGVSWANVSKVCGVSKASVDTVNGVQSVAIRAKFAVLTTSSPQTYGVYFESPSGLVVNWGDGSAPETFTTTGVKTHSYATAGRYKISITNGTTTNIRFGNEAGTTPTLNTAILQPFSASLGLTSGSRMFYGCSQITYWCADWLTSAVTANFTSFGNMFNGCTQFNDPGVSSFNTSNATSMAYMFNNCPQFNQSVANFNTAKVTNISYMFYGCTAFNQSLANFNVTAVTTGLSFLQGSGFTKTNYDLTLVSWGAQAVKSGVPLHFGSAKYGIGAPADARGVLTGTYSWTITDGGAA